MPRVLLHGIQDGLRLKASRLERRPGHMALARMLRDAEDGPLRIVDPIRRKQATERRHEHHAPAILHLFRQRRHVLGLFRQAQIVDQELDARPGYRDAALERVDWFVVVAEMVRYRCQ